jgi:hypothetical protein
MANFAPYQDVIPERTRALSPSPTTSPRPERQAQKQAQSNAPRNIGTAAVTSPNSPPPNTSNQFGSGGGWNGVADGGGFGAYRDIEGDVEEGGAGLLGGGGGGGGVRRSFGGGREDVDLFETRLGIRMDWEACLAYLLLPPAGGVLLLVLEHKSDYVRYVFLFVLSAALLHAFRFPNSRSEMISLACFWDLLLMDLLILGSTRGNRPSFSPSSS